MALNRRDFLELTAASSSALLFPSLDAWAALPKPTGTGRMHAGFDLRIMATNWGFAGSVEEYCARVKKEGYNGIEIWWPMEKQAQDDLFAALRTYSLDVGFLCAGFDPDYPKHFQQFTQMVDAAATQTVQRPLYINCHSGRDYFSYEQNKKLIDHTRELSAKTGLVICHETHRSRMLFAAPVARHYLDTVADLRVTFDVSHWCNVSETLLQDQQETLSITLPRVDHIHARVGHPEGPQVNDPRAPEWADALKAHVGWWDQIVDMKKKAGQRLTILTEFGPPDYMPTLPYTREPLADQWAINVHMMQMLRKRYLP
jgi:sugar phosphate isomerase/epimerase